MTAIKDSRTAVSSLVALLGPKNKTTFLRNINVIDTAFLFYACPLAISD